jgi:hypothetical protein
MARTGPGKFETSGTLGQLLYAMSLDGADEEAVDVSEQGVWYGLLRGPFSLRELKQEYPEEYRQIDRDDVEALRVSVGAIVTEDDSGFVDVVMYESKAKLKSDWHRTARAYGEE